MLVTFWILLAVKCPPESIFLILTRVGFMVIFSGFDFGLGQKIQKIGVFPGSGLCDPEQMIPTVRI